jgi:hypothetical protein
MPNRDTGKIILGLVVFLVLVSFPIWNAVTRGQSGEPPQLVYPADATQCVEETAYMRSWHMDLLNEWRDEVVRGGERTYVADLGHREYDMSLQNTCMKCHLNKDTFCDRCHSYVGVAPKCWECHVEPGGVSHGQG